VSDIKVGDLVQVIKDSACPIEPKPSSDLGHIFTVQKISPLGNVDGSWCFNGCQSHYSNSELGAWDDGFILPLSRLKRIKPLDELERDQIVKELAA
jgi:hypothetical protein